MVLGSGIRDPGSEIRDPRSGIRDPEKTYSGSRIPDPGSRSQKAPDPESRIRIRNTALISGSGSGRPQKMWIRIRNTAACHSIQI
jgi:hypothetical protein